MKRFWALAGSLLVIAGLGVTTAPAAHAVSGAMIVPATGSVTGVVGHHCGKNDTHAGIDIARSSGGPIVAAAAGTVSQVINSSAATGYGTYVVVQHSAGYETRYGHMVVNSPRVAIGQAVGQGEVLGSMGTTGNSTGVHLHFEVRLNGTPQTGINSFFPCGKAVTLGQPIAWEFPGLGGGAAGPDTDADGIADSADVCAVTAGFGKYKGCPLPRTANSTDFTGDGTADVFFANPNGQWWLSEGASKAWRNLNTGNVQGALLQFADFNGDAIADVFYPNPANGDWLVSLGGTSAWTRWNSAPGAAAEDLQLGDFDGDGRADVMWANSVRAEWWVSYGGNTGWTVLNTGVPDTDIRVADLNGDGRDDVFYAHPNGQWWVSDNGTTGWRLLNNASVEGAQLKFGDMNGDGADDVLWPNPADGRWLVSYSGASGWAALATGNVPGEQLQVADVDANGKADVFFPNVATGQWLVSDGGVASWRMTAGGTTVHHSLLTIR
jgi:hypothetical protein